MQKQLTAYLDPNYTPAFSYGQLEGWLLLYDTLYVSSPSSHEIRRAEEARELPVSRDSILRLTENRYVVPVGRPRYFNPVWRKERARELAALDVERADHFHWDDDFDEGIAAKAYRLSDAGLDAAIRAGMDIEHRHPDVFEQLAIRVAALRAARNLPAKFYTPSEIDRPLNEIVRGVIYEVAGDLWARSTLRSHLIVPREYGPLYEELSHMSGAAKSLDDPVLTTPEVTIEDLSDDEVRLAHEFAERLAKRFTIADILPEYRASGLQRQFRRFIASTLQSLRADITDRDRGDVLWHKFDDRVRNLGNLKKYVDWLAPAPMSYLIARPEVQEFYKQATRRSFLVACLAMAGTAITKAAIDNTVDLVGSSIDDNDRWIALIAGTLKH
jgi:hypothetical protein